MPINGTIPDDLRNDVEPRREDVETLARSLAGWFVRLDGKYYDVRDPGVKLSMPDIQRAALHRFGKAHPEVLLTSPLIREVWRLAIHAIHDEPGLSIPVWNGRRRCDPGRRSRLLPEDGTVALNTWSEPRYRTLADVDASTAAFDDFLSTFFTRPQDREMFLNWLAWCLRVFCGCCP